MINKATASQNTPISDNQTFYTPTGPIHLKFKQRITKDLHTKPTLITTKKKPLTCCHGFIFSQLYRCRTFKTLSEQLMPPKFVTVMTTHARVTNFNVAP